MKSRLQKQVPVRPHFVHTTSITDFYSLFTYIARTIRPTLRTLYSIPSPVLLSLDTGGVRDYPVVVQMDPSGSGGDSAVSTFEVVMATTSTRRFLQPIILV